MSIGRSIHMLIFIFYVTISLIYIYFTE